MKKLVLILLIPFSLFSQSTLIFSEYGEGSSFNKWVEIYNPTFMSISLDEYRYNFCWNGCDSLEWEYSIPFDSGVVLMPNETYLLVHNNSDSILLNAANQTTNILSNGDDVIGLLNTSFNTIIDIIGVLDSADNISAWEVDGIIDATKDHTMIRKPDVCGGNIGDWSLSDGSTAPSQWIVGVIDDFNDLNTHTSDCINSTSIEVFNPIKRELVEVRDVLGRKTKINNNQPFFYIYDDGTVEKRIVIE
ncbi:lamin tail domain-containing protein [Flavobacteriales bacterium]|nr:lamin tail domain-containing protein [Flavobacteriales bacterium]